jgi:hypothetical protein
MTPQWDRRTAGQLVEVALAAVFDVEAVQGLREDSPLSAVGMTSADLVSLADAIADASSARGRTCVLDDRALSDVVTVSDVIDAVTALGGEEPHQ